MSTPQAVRQQSRTNSGITQSLHSTHADKNLKHACEQCHERKIRCFVTTENHAGTCDPCRVNGRKCLFALKSKTGRPRKLSTAKSTAQDDSGRMLSTPVASSALSPWQDTPAASGLHQYVTEPFETTFQHATMDHTLPAPELYGADLNSLESVNLFESFHAIDMLDEMMELHESHEADDDNYSMLQNSYNLVLDDLNKNFHEDDPIFQYAGIDSLNDTRMANFDLHNMGPSDDGNYDTTTPSTDGSNHSSAPGLDKYRLPSMSMQCDTSRTSPAELNPKLDDLPCGDVATSYTAALKCAQHVHKLLAAMIHQTPKSLEQGRVSVHTIMTSLDTLAQLINKLSNKVTAPYFNDLTTTVILLRCTVDATMICQRLLSFMKVQKNPPHSQSPLDRLNMQLPDQNMQVRSSGRNNDRPVKASSTSRGQLLRARTDSVLPEHDLGQISNWDGLKSRRTGFYSPQDVLLHDINNDCGQQTSLNWLIILTRLDYYASSFKRFLQLFHHQSQNLEVSKTENTKLYGNGYTMATANLEILFASVVGQITDACSPVSSSQSTSIVHCIERLEKIRINIRSQLARIRREMDT